MPVYIDHCRIRKHRFGYRIRPVNMDMPMQMVFGLESSYKPAIRLNPAVSIIRLVVNAPWWGMGDENIEEIPIS